MSYKIQYTPEDAQRYPEKVIKRQIKWRKAVMIGAILACCVWMSVRGIPDFLIPGDPVVTKAAAADLLDQLRSGVSMETAVNVFCKQILDGTHP